MEEMVRNFLEDIAGTDGLEYAAKGDVDGVIKLYVNYGRYDDTLSSELITVLGRWDGTLYSNSEYEKGDYNFILG